MEKEVSVLSVDHHTSEYVTFNSALKAYLLLRLMQQHHQFRRREKLTLTHSG